MQVEIAEHWLPYPVEETEEHTVTGEVRVLKEVWSPQLENHRDILVYLPPSYFRSEKRYPVLYMHDGQNLFDEATSHAGEWGVDETMEAESRHGLEAIVVGIPNMCDDRCDEYSPWPDPESGGGRGDAYIDFIVDTLKPIVDRDFRTRPEQEMTGIFGSSMGGLISLYGFFRNDYTFGFCGAMSPSLWFADRQLYRYLCEAPFVSGRIYMDVGTAEGEEALEDARRVRAFLEVLGYSSGDMLRYLEFPNADHSEAAWGARLRRALRFLVPRTK
jgi:isoamylase